MRGFAGLNDRLLRRFTGKMAPPERYRSGHNGADSKSDGQVSWHVGSNPTLSARIAKSPLNLGFSALFPYAGEPSKWAIRAILCENTCEYSPLAARNFLFQDGGSKALARRLREPDRTEKIA